VQTEEEDRRLERRLAACLDADIEEMLRDLEQDDPPHPAPVERARRSPRRPTLAAAPKEASKAGAHVSGAVIEPGKIELRFGERLLARNMLPTALRVCQINLPMRAGEAR
jgi:hypothetical protein